MPPSFARAATLLRDALADFLPPRRISVSEWAAQNRWLSNEGGGHVGRWDNAIAPYLVEPMDALTSHDHSVVAIVGPGQCGKTEVANNWTFHSVDTDPASFLRYMQTDDALRSYVKDRIDTLIDEHPAIKAKLGLRPVDDSLGFKRFKAMTVQFLAATRSNLISKSAPRIVGDEIDAYDKSIADFLSLADIRRQTYGADSKALLISHPDLAGGADPAKWQAGIMSYYRDSNRCTWWWACPHCSAWSSPNPGTPRQMVLSYPENAPLGLVAAETRLVCPSNGCLIDEDGRRAMIRSGGRWLGIGQTIEPDGAVFGERIPSKIAGYWIVGVMSPFLLYGMGGLAAARVRAMRAIEAGEEDTSLREVMTKQWGIPYDAPRKLGSMDAATLVDRAEPSLILGAVPAGVRFITCSADVQARGFDILRRGWGEHGESWVLGVERLIADPATDPAAWDALLDALRRPLPLADGSGRVMRPRAVSMDLGGAAGVTSRAYEAWLRWRRAGQARLLGKQDARDAWDVLPTQGANALQAMRLVVAYPDDVRRDRRASSLSRGQVPVARFNPNLFKDDLAAQLARPMPGPWYVHLPAGLKEAGGPPHPWFEQLVAERRALNGSWHKATPNQRNEAMDTMVMTHVLARLHGIGRIDWERPPAWAAPWDTNPMVGPVGAEPAPAAPPATAQVVPQPLPLPQPGAAQSAARGAYFKPPAALRGFFRRP